MLSPHLLRGLAVEVNLRSPPASFDARKDPSKNYRYSIDLQVAIDASTRLDIAVGDPQPGNRNDTIVYPIVVSTRSWTGPVMADRVYRGNPGPVPDPTT